MRSIIAILLLSSVVVSAQTNRPLAAVNTIADLVARNSVNNERVVVAGWVTPGDWGTERIIRHDPASVAATNMGCVFASSTAGRYIADDCESGQVNIRWWGGTNDVTALAAALTHVISRPASVEIVDRAVWLADGVAPTAAAGTMALYATNLAGVHELGIAHGGGSNNIVATKAWVGSTITGTAVTSVGATSTVTGLGFSGGPITGSGTLTLTGTVASGSGSVTSVAAASSLAGIGWSGSPITSGGTLTITGILGSANIDATIARGSDITTHAAQTNVHGISVYGASLAAETSAADARTRLGLGTAATNAASAFESSGAVATHAGQTNIHGISVYGASLAAETSAADARTRLGLGTAATKDIPAAGNASSTQVVYGSDTRLYDSRSPTSHASSHALAGSDPVARYLLSHVSIGVTSVDSTTYYVGKFWDTAYKTNAGVIFPASGTIRYVRVQAANFAAASSEPVPLFLRIANTTDYSLGTNSWANLHADYILSNANISVTAGQDAVVKFTTPAWVTNTTTVIGLWIYVE